MTPGVPVRDRLRLAGVKNEMALCLKRLRFQEPRQSELSYAEAAV
jgi:hypothetical protein